MTWALGLAGVAVAVALSALFSGSETGLYCLNRLRLKLDVGAGQRGALRLDRLLEDEPAALATTLVGTNAMNYTATMLAAVLIARASATSGAAVELTTTLIMTPILFVFGEIVPKNLFQAGADVLMRRVSAALLIAHGVLRVTGIVPAMTALSRLAARYLPGDLDPAHAESPKRRVAAQLTNALLDRAPDTALSAVVERVVTLSETPLHRVMVRRNQVVSIAARADRSTLLRIARATTHTRLPVFDPATDRIVGVVKVDELIRTHDWTVVGEKVRPVMRMSGRATVAGAITRAREARHSMIVVVNRGGRMVGIATLKDLLEEIVGELSAW